MIYPCKSGIELLLRSSFVSLAHIEFIQIEAQFDRIKRTFRHLCWQVTDRLVVFCGCVFKAILRIINRACNRVQPVAIGIDPPGLLNKASGGVRLAEAYQGLRGAEI